MVKYPWVLTFDNPIFRVKELNFVIKLEDEWKRIPIGQEVLLKSAKNNEEEKPMRAYVTHVIRCFLFNIPKKVLELMHDPEQKHFGKLYNHLISVYGEDNVGMMKEVVCIGFIPSGEFADNGS